MARTKDRYHHGNLRAALLKGGIALLEKRGMEGLTLRQVAAAAGVSHAAPAHYFPSLKHLLTALAAIGFERFDLAMRQARNAASTSIDDQLHAAAAGYVSFASQNPALFRLMFSKALTDSSDPTLRLHADAAFAQLQAISDPVAVMLGVDGIADTLDLQKLVWSVAHGYAHLYIEGQMQSFDADANGQGTFMNPPNLGRYLFKRRSGFP